MLRYHTWGPNRGNRPSILSEIEPTSHVNPTYTIPEWFDSGQIVLGPDSLPIRCWEHLPHTISSGATGIEMAAWLRLDQRCTVKDIRARMPSQVLRKKGNQTKAKLTNKTYIATKPQKAQYQMGLKHWDSPGRFAEYYRFLGRTSPGEGLGTLKKRDMGGVEEGAVVEDDDKGEDQDDEDDASDGSD
ncbi:MAG: hypothetical protein Q9218_004495 [Villophora microphyllina]